MGLLDNSARGVWTLTEKGRDPSLDVDKVLRLLAERNAKSRSRPKARSKAERDRAPDDVDDRTRTSLATGRRSCWMPCWRCPRRGSSG